MKKIKLLLIGLAFVSMNAFSQASDSFNYTGSLNANGWTTNSGTNPGELVTVSGSLSYLGIPSTGNKAKIIAGNGEDVNLASAVPLTGVAYYSAIINLPDTDGLSPNTDNGSYFLTFGSTAGANVTIYNGRIYNKLGTQPNTFNLAVMNGAGGTSNPTYTGVDYPINTPLFLVVKFDFSTNTASLFVNPVVGSSEGTPTVTNNTGTTAAPPQFASLVIRQAGTATQGSGNVEIDEVRIGATWEYVTYGVLKTNENEIAGLKVYPNPVVDGKIYITSDDNQTKTISITNMLGKEVFVGNSDYQEINIPKLNSGIYLIKISEGSKCTTKKLIVQ